MTLIKAKLKREEPADYVERRRVMNWLKESEQRFPKAFLYGAFGMGKTTEMLHYIAKHYEQRYGYFCLDVCDNQVTQFRAYFVAMIQNAGCNITSEMEQMELHDLISEVLHLLEKDETPRFLLFDGLQTINDPQILQEIELFWSYVPAHIRCWGICEQRPHPQVERLVHRQEIEVLSAHWITMNPEEMELYLNKTKWKLKREQIEEICDVTGGWLGAFQKIKSFYEEQRIDITDLSYLENPMLDTYITENFWKKQSELQKSILKEGCRYPYINGEFFAEILDLHIDKQEFLWLEKIGVLEYDLSGKVYTICPMLQRYIDRNALDRNDQLETTWRMAADWYKKHQMIEAAIECLSRQFDKTDLKNYMADNTQALLQVVTGAKIKEYLCRIPGVVEEPNLWFLMGAASLRMEDYYVADQTQQLLIECEQSAKKSQKRKIVELLMNLFYMDARVSAVEWMELAERYGAEDIRLYDASGEKPSIRCGAKDLTMLFADGTKQEKIYQKKFQKIVCRQQHVLFEIASVEYMLDTDRAKQALEVSQSLLISGEEHREADEVLGILGVVSQLYRKQLIDESYSEIKAYLMQQLKKYQMPMAENNVIALQSYMEGWGRQKTRINQWLQYEANNHIMELTYENVFEHLFQAKSYLLINEYAKAKAVFQRVERFFAKRNQPKYLAESFFGEGVCAYAMGQRSEALKLATKGLTLGIKYRYIDIYTEYGQNGFELIELYQSMVEGTEKNRVLIRKKYFYGNILKASYEEYETILYRCAKKTAKKLVSTIAREEDKLTVTEQMIMELLGDGQSNQEIADDMNIKITTVKSHVYSIYRKLEVKNRIEAITKAKNLGII